MLHALWCLCNVNDNPLTDHWLGDSLECRRIVHWAKVFNKGWNSYKNPWLFSLPRQTGFQGRSCTFFPTPFDHGMQGPHSENWCLDLLAKKINCNKTRMTWIKYPTTATTIGHSMHEEGSYERSYRKENSGHSLPGPLGETQADRIINQMDRMIG